MFTVHGVTTITDGRRREASLTWHDDGTLTGDNGLAAEAETLARYGTWVDATPTGPGGPAALLPRDAAAILVMSLFDSFGWEGDFPARLLDVPEGAIP